MAKKISEKGGVVTYGPYKKVDGKRTMVVKYDKNKKDHKVTSQNEARYEYEKRNGKVSKGNEVDHTDTDTTNNSANNLQVLSKSDNVAKRNKAVAGKKTSTANKKS